MRDPARRRLLHQLDEYKLVDKDMLLVSYVELFEESPEKGFRHPSVVAVERGHQQRSDFSPGRLAPPSIADTFTLNSFLPSIFWHPTLVLSKATRERESPGRRANGCWPVTSSRYTDSFILSAGVSSSAFRMVSFYTYTHLGRGVLYLV